MYLYALLVLHLVGSAVSQLIPAGVQADIYTNQIQGQNPIVDTPAGSLKGFVSETSRDKTKYEAYVGIPFAQPPVGALRFKAPVPFPKWDGVRDALQEGPSCYFQDSPLPISEDCLYLNVFKPSSTTSSPRAVMVFIYGGSFNKGSSNTLVYGPDFLLDQDVILVTLNYRTGPLGFLSLQTEFAPGNAGLKDQLEALRWVKNNIASFGGNPNNITVFGQSAGSASIVYLLLSNLSAGLFNQVILESGNCLNDWAYIPPADAIKSANTLAATVGCVNPAQIEQCLQTVSAQKLTNNQGDAVGLTDYFNKRIFVFVPTTEDPTTSTSPVITTDPRQLVTQGLFQRNVSVILGSNLNEGYFIYPTLNSADPLRLTILAANADLSFLAPNSLQITSHPIQLPYVNNEMRKHYIKNIVATYFTADEVLDILTDSYFILPAQEFYKYLLQYSQANIYNYFFVFDGAFPFYKKQYNLTVKGVVHADELGYLFNAGRLYTEYTQVSNRQDPSQVTISRMTTMWANFAKFGKPVPQTSALLPAEWLPSTSSQLNYYNINSTLNGNVCLDYCAMTFWNNIYNTVLGVKPYPEQSTSAVCLNADGTPAS